MGLDLSIVFKSKKFKDLSIYPYLTFTKLAPCADYLAVTGNRRSKWVTSANTL